MPVFNDISLCEELSKFINVNDSMPDILFALQSIPVDEISERNQKKFINFQRGDEKEFEVFVINNVENFDIDYNHFIIRRDNNEFLMYNLEGEYIFKYSKEYCFNLDYYDKINDINKIWEVVGIEDGKIFLM